MIDSGTVKPGVQWIRAHGRDIALLIRAGYQPASTEFLTPDEYKQQLGFVVRPEGAVIAAHTHQPTERHLSGMSELLIVRDGLCAVDLYDEGGALVTTIELGTGDALLIVGGGHGVRMIRPTIILEVKQGPFAGPDDKVLLRP